MAKNNPLNFSFRNWFEHEKDDLKDDFYIYPKRRLLITLLVVVVLLFGIFQIWSLISSQTLLNWDLVIENGMRTIRNTQGYNLFSLVTFLGSQYFILGLGFLLMIPLFLKHRKKAAVSFFFVLVGTVALVVLLKQIFGRERPIGCPMGRDCFSFPSGHVSLAFYFYGIVTYLLARFIRIRKRYFLPWIFGISSIVLLIAVSRIYLGFHFFSDIVGGFLLGGISWLTAAILIDFLYTRYS